LMPMADQARGSLLASGARLETMVIDELPRWPLPPLFVKVAIISTCLLGLWATVQLMDQFGNVLKPLVLASMLAGCLEKPVEWCECGLTRSLAWIWMIVRCKCNWRRVMKIYRVFRPRGEAPTTPGGQDVYHTLESLAEDEPCFPEAAQAEAMQVWHAGDRASNPVTRLISIAVVLAVVGLLLLNLSSSLIASLHSLDLNIYKKGFQELETLVLGLFQNASPSAKENLTRQLDSVQHNLTSFALAALNDVLSGTTNFAVQTVMFMLYVFMWLLAPLSRGESVFIIVRTYFMCKTLCNGLFAVCVAGLLTWIGCDLCLVISILCFFLGFIPEVGSFISIVLPIPLLLLDSRKSMELRGANMLTMVVGMLLIKFVVSNGIESYVMSRNPILAGQVDGAAKAEETHPVIILFAVVFFGEIWGVTGMLISVPLLSLVRLVVNMEGMDKRQEKEEKSVEEVASTATPVGRLPVPVTTVTVSPRKDGRTSYISDVASSTRNSRTFSREPSVP